MVSVIRLGFMFVLLPFFCLIHFWGIGLHFWVNIVTSFKIYVYGCVSVVRAESFPRMSSMAVDNSALTNEGHSWRK